MPRTKSNKVAPVANRDECDAALARIAAINREAAYLDGKMNEAIDRIKTQTADAALPLKKELKKLEAGIEAYARANRDELFPAKKSADFPHGTLTFRWTSWVVTTKNTLALLLRRKNTTAVITKQSVDKDVLAGWNEDDLAKVEAHLERVDTFGYEASEQIVARA